MSEQSLLELGTFAVESGKLIVSDPCYAEDVWCCNAVEQVRCGTWSAEAEVRDEGEWGQRIAVLRAKAAIQPAKLPEPDIAPFAVAVDSGQAGIFDARYYRNSDMIRPTTGVRNDDPDAWYWFCCNVTLSQLQAGVIPYGAVSSSGYGDGCYECRIYRDQAGLAFRIEIIYIEDEEECEDDEED